MNTGICKNFSENLLQAQMIGGQIDFEAVRFRRVIINMVWGLRFNFPYQLREAIAGKIPGNRYPVLA